MTRLILTTPAHTHTLALDFAPDSLPGRGVLRMWLDAFGSKLSVSELRDRLRLGTPFSFGDGTISWQDTGDNHVEN